MICAGIDAGSRAIKAVVFDADSMVVRGAAARDQGVQQEELAAELYEQVLADSGLDRNDVGRIVATGYGRHALGLADTAVTEITCHGRGVRHLMPDARTIVDIGGQDSKLIRLDAAGNVQDFSMNDRCAAGTGCFLEVVAQRLGLSLQELGAVAGRSQTPAAISSMCVVFAETEIIGLLAARTAPGDIVAGVQKAIAARIGSMAGRALDAPVVFTGGVAMVPGMSTALEEVLGVPLLIAPRPQFTGALGAAITAARQLV